MLYIYVITDSIFTDPALMKKHGEYEQDTDTDLKMALQTLSYWPLVLEDIMTMLVKVFQGRLL